MPDRSVPSGGGRLRPWALRPVSRPDAPLAIPHGPLRKANLLRWEADVLLPRHPAGPEEDIPVAAQMRRVAL